MLYQPKPIRFQGCAYSCIWQLLQLFGLKYQAFFLFMFFLFGICLPSVGQHTDTIVYYKVDPYPCFSYKGVNKTGIACKTYFDEHVIVPSKKMDKQFFGKIYIQFVVEKDGTLSHIKLLKGVDPKLDKLALKAVKKMPRWNPGQLNGKNVRTWYAVAVKWSYPTGGPVASSEETDEPADSPMVD